MRRAASDVQCFGAKTTTPRAVTPSGSGMDWKPWALGPSRRTARWKPSLGSTRPLDTYVFQTPTPATSSSAPAQTFIAFMHSPCRRRGCRRPPRVISGRRAPPAHGGSLAHSRRRPATMRRCASIPGSRAPSCSSPVARVEDRECSTHRRTDARLRRRGARRIRAGDARRASRGAALLRLADLEAGIAATPADQLPSRLGHQAVHRRGDPAAGAGRKARLDDPVRRVAALAAGRRGHGDDPPPADAHRRADRLRRRDGPRRRRARCTTPTCCGCSNRRTAPTSRRARVIATATAAMRCWR